MICFQRFESIKKLRNTQRLVDLPMNNADLRPGVAAINTWAVVRWHPVLVQLLVQLVELQVASTSYIPAVEDLYILLAEDLYIILLAGGFVHHSSGGGFVHHSSGGGFVHSSGGGMIHEVHGGEFVHHDGGAHIVHVEHHGWVESGSQAFTPVLMSGDLWVWEWQGWGKASKWAMNKKPD